MTARPTVHNAVAQDDLEFVQNFGSAQCAVRAVNLKDHVMTRKPHERRADLDALAGEGCHEGIMEFPRLTVH